MEFFRKVEPSRKLNTKGCCFLCLKNEEISQTKDTEGNQVVKSTSIRSILRHLEITAQSLNVGLLVEQDLEKREDIQVYLCENCGHMISRFSLLFQELEKIKLEMGYFLEKIHKCISQSAKAPELVQNYSKRMTSDLEALSQLAFVDNLRKQVSKRCLKEMNVPRLHVILTRENYTRIKTENPETLYGSDDDGDIPGNVYDKSEIRLPDFTSSPPPSPISTEDNEEEVKFSQSFALTENDKLSPKPPVKQETKKSKYYAKHPSSGMYKCRKCEKKSKCRQTIRDHFKSVHLKLKLKCDICSVSVFNNLPNLKVHKKTCQEKLEKKLAKEKDPKFKFICKVCGKRFDTNKKLAHHTKWVHQNVDRYKCDLCDKKYTSPGGPKNHQAVIHQSRKLYCKKCNKMYKDLGRYRTHERNCVAVIKIKLETGLE